MATAIEISPCKFAFADVKLGFDVSTGTVDAVPAETRLVKELPIPEMEPVAILPEGKGAVAGIMTSTKLDVRKQTNHVLSMASILASEVDLPLSS